MPFKPLEEILASRPPIVLPIRGKEYTLPVLDVPAQARLAAMLNGTDTESTFNDLLGLLLGDALEQMQADNVSPAAIDRAFFTAVTDGTEGRDAAENTWENGVPAELLKLAHATVQGVIETAGNTATPPTSQPRRKPTDRRPKAA